MRRRAWLAGALAALSLTVAACGSSGGDASPSPSPSGIATTLADFSIKPAEKEAPAGSVTFDLQNDGPSDHTFYVVRTDLADDALPVKDHLVQLSGLDVVAKLDNVPFNAAPSLTLSMTPGAYVFLCIYPGHYESGMFAAFTVT
jgi:uncharacterized cupredoxin-like copper-binding protein